MTLFAVGRSSSRIEPREFDRVTEYTAFRTYNGRKVKELRHQTFLHLFSTEEEAISYVLDRLQRNLSSANNAVTYAAEELHTFKNKYGLAEESK